MRSALLLTVIAFSLWSLHIAAQGSAPVANAGPDSTVQLPIVDATLWGSATDADDDDMRASWALTSGPGGSSFSASGSFTTTLSFTSAGTYVATLTVTDDTGASSTDSATITVQAAATTEYYVDPTFTGGSNAGTAANPWTALCNTVGCAASGSVGGWNTINTALASGSVTIYYSARVAGADTPESTTAGIDMWRTDASTNRLLFDGKSKYNTNDAAGSWANYSGSNKFNIAVASGSVGIGSQGSAGSVYPHNYTTIRGFDVSGDSGRVLFIGDHSTLEYTDVHDIVNIGATIQLQPPVRDYPTCTESFGNRQYMTIRNNTAIRGHGEGVYISGTYYSEGSGGCPDNYEGGGQTHRYILVESNTLDMANTNGSGQADGIDAKSGIRDLTIRNNTITGSPSSTNFITLSGIFPTYPSTTSYTDRTNYFIENNTFTTGAGRCLSVSNLNYAVFRNNICDATTGGGLTLTSGASVSWPNATVTKTDIFNNDLSQITNVCVATNDATNLRLRNNVISLGSGQEITKSGLAAQPDSDYNVLNSGRSFGGSWVEGANSVELANGTTIYADEAGGDFTITALSPIANIAVNLSYIFRFDRVYTERPTAGAWDAGAYEVVNTQAGGARMRIR